MRIHFKISIFILVLGWVPLLILAAISSENIIYRELEIILVVIGTGFCVMGSLAMFGNDLNKIFLSIDELNKAKKEYEEANEYAVDVLNAIMQIAAKKEGFSKKEIDERVRKIKQKRRNE